MADDEAQGGLACALAADRQALGRSLKAGEQARLLEAHRLGAGLGAVGGLPGGSGDPGSRRRPSRWAVRGQCVEHQSALGLSHVGAIESQNVEVNIQSQRRVGPLDGHHGAGQGLAHAAEAEQPLGATSQ
jgi:hypothetical protein